MPRSPPWIPGLVHPHSLTAAPLVRLLKDNQIAASAIVELHDPARFDLNGFDEAIDTLQEDGTVVLGTFPGRGMIEFYPLEALKTNALGAENVLCAAMNHGVQKAIVLSTDKAVYPINAMGISKAMMEKLMIAKARVASQ